jgi:L-threonylcarbamoyladenylate synthase
LPGTLTPSAFAAIRNPRRTGLLAWQTPPPEIAAAFATVETLSPAGDLREAAARLFAAMRRLDEAGLEAIVAEPIPETGLGMAIMDRLRKAAAAHPFPPLFPQP